MSFNICRGTLGSLAMFTAIRNASSRVSSFAADRRPARLSIAIKKLHLDEGSILLG